MPGKAKAGTPFGDPASAMNSPTYTESACPPGSPVAGRGASVVFSIPLLLLSQAALYHTGAADSKGQLRAPALEGFAEGSDNALFFTS